MQEVLSKASDRWPHLLVTLGGIRDDQLTNAHQPCPSCGGTDRYRWLMDEGPGGWWCSHCGGKNRQGGAGSGIDLLMRVRNWSFSQAIREITGYYNGLPFQPAPRHIPAPLKTLLDQKHSELQRFQLLEIAGQLSSGSFYLPSEARNRMYSKRWAAFASSNYEAACSVVIEFETCRGIEPLLIMEESDERV
jgi:phage/plasmid primase-like uncharacterized protein